MGTTLKVITAVYDVKLTVTTQHYTTRLTSTIMTKTTQKYDKRSVHL